MLTRAGTGAGIARSLGVWLTLCLMMSVAGCSRSGPFTGVGEVTEVEAGRHRVTIRHDGIEGRMPAGTADCVAPPEMLAGLTAGTRVRFEVRHDGDALLLTRIARLDEGMPGMHDHTPHHGGVVAMVGMIHLEALALADGRVHVYLTDRWRRPLPLDTVKGSVTLRLPDGKRTLPFSRADDFMEAQAPPLRRSEVNAYVELWRDGEAIEMTFQLPLEQGGRAAAGVPSEGCVSPPEQRGGSRLPRCTLNFPRTVSAIGATPDGTAALIGVVDMGVTVWRIPSGELSVGLQPPPPITVPVNEAPHPEAPSEIAVSPDGTEAVVALESRLLRYDISSGQLVKELAAPGGVVRAAAWSPLDEELAVTAFYDPAAHLVRGEDGRELRRFSVDREAAAVAFSRQGNLLAVGSQIGAISVFEVASGTRWRTLLGPAGPTRALAFVPTGLLAAGDDGVLHLWDPATATVSREGPPGRPVVQLAVRADGRLAATADWDGAIRLYDPETLAVVEVLTWHAAPVYGLAWAGSVLVSGDARGQVALWDLDDARGTASRSTPVATARPGIATSD